MWILPEPYPCEHQPCENSVIFHGSRYLTHRTYGVREPTRDALLTEVGPKVESCRARYDKAFNKEDRQEGLKEFEGLDPSGEGLEQHPVLALIQTNTEAGGLTGSFTGGGETISLPLRPCRQVNRVVRPISVTDSKDPQRAVANSSLWARTI